MATHDPPGSELVGVLCVVVLRSLPLALISFAFVDAITTAVVNKVGRSVMADTAPLSPPATPGSAEVETSWSVTSVIAKVVVPNSIVVVSGSTDVEASSSAHQPVLTNTNAKSRTSRNIAVWHQDVIAPPPRNPKTPECLFRSFHWMTPVKMTSEALCRLRTRSVVCKRVVSTAHSPLLHHVLNWPHQITFPPVLNSHEVGKFLHEGDRLFTNRCKPGSGLRSETRTPVTDRTPRGQELPGANGAVPRTGLLPLSLTSSSSCDLSRRTLGRGGVRARTVSTRKEGQWLWFTRQGK